MIYPCFIVKKKSNFHVYDQSLKIASFYNITKLVMFRFAVRHNVGCVSKLKSSKSFRSNGRYLQTLIQNKQSHFHRHKKSKRININHSYLPIISIRVWIFGFGINWSLYIFMESK